MGFSVNFKDFDKFVKNMNTLEKDFNKFLRKFLLQMAYRVLAKVKPITPVVTGELKRNWELGKVQGEGKNISVEILNGMEYATDFEYGHRIVRNNVEVGWCEGRFILKTSIDKIKAQMPSRYNEEFKKFCEAKGIKC